MAGQNYEKCLYWKGDSMKTTTEQNKRLVLEAFDTLFNKRDYAAAEKFWSPDYIQHSAHIEPGREGLFNLIKGMPATLKYEHGPIVVAGDFVMVHGRLGGFALQGRGHAKITVSDDWSVFVFQG